MADPIIPPDQQPPVPPQPQQSWLQQYGPTLGALALGYLRGAGAPRLQGGYNAAATGLGTAMDAYSGLSQMAQQQQAEQARQRALAQMGPQAQQAVTAGVPVKEVWERTQGVESNKALAAQLDQALQGNLPQAQRQNYTMWSAALKASSVPVDASKILPKLSADKAPSTLVAAAIQKAISEGKDPVAAAQAAEQQERQAESGMILSREKALKDYEKSLKAGGAMPEKEARAALAADPGNEHLKEIVRQFDLQKAATEGTKFTAATRSMKEVAPTVEKFTDRIDKLIDLNEKQLGPGAGRWSEFMAGKVGAENKDFTKLRTNIGLLTTSLMRMHVGARGGVELMKHFQDMIDSGRQSPGNLRAAIGEIRNYAKSMEGKPIEEEDPLGDVSEAP